MIRLTLLVASAIALAVASGAFAKSEGENLHFIDMIVSFLNNQQKCTLPSYSEVDEAARRFRELEQNSETFEQSLSADQKLLRETVLDQWDSFQKYLTSENVLKSAKKRAFLGKVEKYQEQKFGNSICTQSPDTNVLDDPVYERNPLVRYVKQFGGQGKSGSADANTGSNAAAETSPANGESDNDVELKFKVHNRDGSGNIQSSKQYVTKFNFDKSRPQNRITLHIGEKK